MYDFILFDLDGTLVNSEPGIRSSLLYAFKECGISYDGDLRKFIGPPFSYSLPAFLGTDAATTDALIKAYRSHYNSQGILGTRLFKGIKDLLVSLKNSGKKIALATTKPRIYAKRILVTKGIAPYFDFVAGCELDGSINDKKDVLRYIFAGTDFDPRRSVLVGDTVYDCEGAAIVNIDCIGVTYGFGKKEDLIAAKAVNIAKSVKELKNILLETI